MSDVLQRDHVPSSSKAEGKSVRTSRTFSKIVRRAVTQTPKDEDHTKLTELSAARMRLMAPRGLRHKVVDTDK